MKYKILSTIFLFIAGFMFLAMIMDDCYAHMSYIKQNISTPFIYYILLNFIDYGIIFVPFGVLGFYCLKKSREK